MNPENKPFQNVGQQQNQNQPGPSTQTPAPQQEMGFDKFVAVALIVGLIAGFIIGHGYGASSANKKNRNNDNPSATTTEKAVNKSQGENNSSVTVSDQPAGSNVVIENLVLDSTYWVAVRDSEETNQVRYVLGARRLSAGTYEDISIYLPRPTQSGKQYDIVFYKDSPKINLGADNIVKLDDSVARATFKAN